MPGDIDSVTLLVENDGNTFQLPLHGGGDDPNAYSGRMNSNAFEGDTGFTAVAHSAIWPDDAIYASAPQTVSIDATSVVSHVVNLLMNAVYGAPDFAGELSPAYLSATASPSTVSVGDTVTITVHAVDPDGDDSTLIQTMHQDADAGTAGYLNNVPLPGQCVGAVCTFTYTPVAADFHAGNGGHDLNFLFRAEDAQGHEGEMAVSVQIDTPSTTDISISVENQSPWFSDLHLEDFTSYHHPGSDGTDSLWGIKINDDHAGIATWEVEIVKVDEATGATLTDIADDCHLDRLSIEEIDPVTEVSSPVVGHSGTIVGSAQTIDITYTPNVVHPSPHVKCKMTMTLDDGANTPVVMDVFQYVGDVDPASMGPAIVMSFISSMAPPDTTLVDYTVYVRTHDASYAAPTAGYSITGFSNDPTPVTGAAMIQDPNGDGDLTLFSYTEQFTSNGAGGTNVFTVSQVVTSTSGTHTLTDTETMAIDAASRRRLTSLTSTETEVARTDTNSLNVRVEIVGGELIAYASLPDGPVPPEENDDTVAITIGVCATVFLAVVVISSTRRTQAAAVAGKGVARQDNPTEVLEHEPVPVVIRY